jgi:hypothetical protein
MTVNLTMSEGLPERVHAAAMAGLLEGAEVVKAISDGNVPVDTGQLIGSADIGSDEDEVQVGYTGLSPQGYDYGVRQHEDLSLHHPNGGSAKFLEDAVHETAEAVFATVAGHVARVL